jgi:K+-transporting ATPase KdpF subunit
MVDAFSQLSVYDYLAILSFIAGIGMTAYLFYALVKAEKF